MGVETGAIGAIGSQDERIATMKKKIFNPAEKNGTQQSGCFVAFDFSKTGETVPGWNNANVPMTGIS